jgi:hypothetical protein
MTAAALSVCSPKIPGSSCSRPLAAPGLPHWDFKNAGWPSAAWERPGQESSPRHSSRTGGHRPAAPLSPLTARLRRAHSPNTGSGQVYL